MDFQDTKSNKNDHQRLYKLQSPNWKQTYRKRCHERLKTSRQKFVCRLRDMSSGGDGDGEDSSMVKSVMAEEWERLSQEEAALPKLGAGGGDADNAMEYDAPVVESNNIDDVLSLFEVIREELLSEERDILAQYEEGVCYDEASLSATLNCLTAKQVSCPVCKTSSLILNKGILFCACGVRVDTEQDSITLDYVQQSVAAAVGQHEGFCEGEPSFGVVGQQVAGMTNLMMTCHECDFMYIVV